MSTKQVKASASERLAVQKMKSEFEKFASVNIDASKEGAFYIRRVELDSAESILLFCGKVIYQGEVLNAQVRYFNPSFRIAITNANKEELEEKSCRFGGKQNKPVENFEHLRELFELDGYIRWDLTKHSHQAERNDGELLTREEQQKQLNASNFTKSKSAVTRLEKLSEAVHNFLLYCNIATHENYKTRWDVFAKDLMQEAQRKDAEQTVADAVTKEQTAIKKSMKNLLNANIDRDKLLEMLSKMLENNE